MFLRCSLFIGGPAVTLDRHTRREASLAMVTLTDAVAPMPVVSIYACPCQF